MRGPAPRAFWQAGSVPWAVAFPARRGRPSEAWPTHRRWRTDSRLSTDDAVRGRESSPSARSSTSSDLRCLVSIGGSKASAGAPCAAEIEPRWRTRCRSSCCSKPPAGEPSTWRCSSARETRSFVTALYSSSISTSARTSEYTSSSDCTSTSPTTRLTSCSSTSSREEAICSHRKDCSAGGSSSSTSMSATGGSSCPSSSESTSAVVVLRIRLAQRPAE